MVVTSDGPDGLDGTLWMGQVSGATSQTWPAANRAVLTPFFLRDPATVAQLFWVNGAAVSDHLDVGIYDSGFNRKVSTGSTAQGTISTQQSVDVTDTPLVPGLYYFAVAFNNNVGRITAHTVPLVATAYQMGIRDAGTSFVLPDPITVNGTVTTALYPYVGFTQAATL